MIKTWWRNQSDCWAASSAPSAMAWSLAQTISGWTVGNFPNVANPQSDPACTLNRERFDVLNEHSASSSYLSLPTMLENSNNLLATSLGCSM